MNSVAKGAGGVFYEVLGDIGRFPLWWYTSGIVFILNGAVKSAGNYSRSLGILVWIKNIFVPMYGQHDWQGCIISVFMRSVQIVGRGIALSIYLVMLVVGVVAYIFVPLVAAAFIVFHLFGGIFA